MKTTDNLIFTIVTLGSVFSLAPFAIDMYLPAMPVMATSLAGSQDAVQASIAIFLLGYAISQLILGPVSDHLGRFPVLIGGLGVFAASSLLIALAQDTDQLLVLRFMQALGGGASVTVFPYIDDRFDERRSTQIISYIMAVVAVAPLIAPVIGAAVLQQFGWQAIFMLLAIYAVPVILAVSVLSRQADREQSGASTKPAAGFRDLPGAYAAVLSQRDVLLHIATGSFAFAGLFVFITASPFIYMQIYGISEQHYALLVGANAAAMIVMNLINARLLAEFPATRKMVFATRLLASISLLMLASLMTETGFIFISGSVIAFIALLGLISANAIAGAMQSTASHAGTVSGLYGVSQFTIGATMSAAISVLHIQGGSSMLTVMALSGLLAFTSTLFIERSASRVIQSGETA